MNFQEYVRKGFGKVGGELQRLSSKLKSMEEAHELILNRFAPPPSPTEEIDALEGRRIFFSFGGSQFFTAASQGSFGTALISEISQDGAFIQTHYPIVEWKITQPDSHQNFGIWKEPVAGNFPLQASGAGYDLNEDIISISYDFQDGGVGRNFQNEPVVGGLLSTFQALKPLPIPTVFQPAAVMKFTPFFERVAFTSIDPVASQAQIRVFYPGYRIVDL